MSSCTWCATPTPSSVFGTSASCRSALLCGPDQRRRLANRARRAGSASVRTPSSRTSPRRRRHTCSRFSTRSRSSAATSCGRRTTRCHTPRHAAGPVTLSVCMLCSACPAGEDRCACGPRCRCAALGSGATHSPTRRRVRFLGRNRLATLHSRRLRRRHAVRLRPLRLHHTRRADHCYTAGL